jgi:hypothetical protein
MMPLRRAAAVKKSRPPTPKGEVFEVHDIPPTPKGEVFEAYAISSEVIKSVFKKCFIIVACNKEIRDLVSCSQTFPSGAGGILCYRTYCLHFCHSLS